MWIWKKISHLKSSVNITLTHSRSTYECLMVAACGFEAIEWYAIGLAWRNFENEWMNEWINDRLNEWESDLHQNPKIEDGMGCWEGVRLLKCIRKLSKNCLRLCGCIWTWTQTFILWVGSLLKRHFLSSNLKHTDNKLHFNSLFFPNYNFYCHFFLLLLMLLQYKR